MESLLSMCCLTIRFMEYLYIGFTVDESLEGMGLVEFSAEGGSKPIPGKMFIPLHVEVSEVMVVPPVLILFCKLYVRIFH